ncbi:MAG: hypothetical protein E7172_06225 [Firmicutes bacterium]|nr:hypothetical protein [Bacillota bacterium]
MRIDVKKKFEKIIFLLLILIPFNIKASMLKIETSNTTIKPNEEVTFTFSSDTTFGSMQSQIIYDVTKWDYVSYQDLSSQTVTNIEDGIIVVSLSDANGISGNFLTLTLKAKDTAVSGRSTISIKTDDCKSTDGLTPIAMESGSLTLKHYLASNNANLKNLTIPNCRIDFHPDTTTYNCPDSNSESVLIIANAEDKHAKLAGTGSVKLNYGDNKIEINVTAEDGTKKNYTVFIKRIDERSKENNLASLSVNGYELNFNNEKTTYDLHVKKNDTTITINAKAKDETSTINGTGTFNLNSDKQQFIIKVTAENESEKIYTINVFKSTENIPSNKLIKLIANDLVLDHNQFINLIGVENNINKLNLIYETLSNTSTYEIKGNENLKDGINIITIKVKDTDLDYNTYTLIVYKESLIKKVNNIEEIKNINQNYLINTLKNNLNIKKSLINKLKNTKFNIKYNVLNNTKGLIYSLTFDKNVILEKDFNIKLNKISAKKYEINIPKNTQVKLFIDDLNLNNKEFYLYSYNQKKDKYSLIKKDVKVKDYYLDFIADGSSMIVLSEEKLANNINYFLIIGIISSIAIISYIGYKRWKKV